MKKNAFTLAEVLLTIGVIGVISALTIPQLVLGQQAQQAKARFNTAYSMITKAVADMENDEISTDPNDYKNAGSFYNVFKNYFKVTIDCGIYSGTKNSDTCVISTTDDKGQITTNDQKSNNYVTKKGNVKANHTLFDDGAFVTNNGMLFMVENTTNNPYGLLVSVDTNGKSKRPNRWGWDLFTFEIKDGEVIPVGDNETSYSEWRNNPEKYCSSTDSSTMNGVTCASMATTEKEYFKKTYGGK